LFVIIDDDPGNLPHQRGGGGGKLAFRMVKKFIGQALAGILAL